MENQEAIKIIEEKLLIADAIGFDAYAWALREKDKEALRTAVRALKNEEK